MNVFVGVGTFMLAGSAISLVAGVIVGGEGRTALLIVALTFGVMGVVFRGVGSRLGKLVGVRPELVESGVRGSALITGLGDTGVTINNDPVLRYDLEVQLAGQSPFEVTIKQRTPRMLMGVAVPGSTVAVGSDPADPNNVAIDWAVMPVAHPAPTSAPTPAGTTRKAADVLRSGRRGEALVISVEDAGDMSELGLIEVGDEGDDDRLFIYELEIKLPGRSPYTTRVGHRTPERFSGTVGPRRRLQVAVDRDDEGAVAIDWDEVR